MRNIAKSIGALRMSDDAVNELKSAAEEFITSVAARAKIITKHSKRETISMADMKLALKEVTLPKAIVE